MNQQRDYVASRIDTYEDERALVVTINTATKDRYKTVMLPSGMRNANFRKNPVVLLAHGGGRDGGGGGLPVARSLWEKASQNKILAKPQFMGRDLSEVADKLFRMYSERWINGFSIGFDPIVEDRPTRSELKAHPEWEGVKTIFREWDLLEYSCVAVPANPEALQEAVQRGYELPEWFDRSTLPDLQEQATKLPVLRGVTMAEMRKLIQEEVKRQVQEGLEVSVKDAQELARGRI